MSTQKGTCSTIIKRDIGSFDIYTEEKAHLSRLPTLRLNIIDKIHLANIQISMHNFTYLYPFFSKKSQTLYGFSVFFEKKTKTSSLPVSCAAKNGPQKPTIYLPS